MDKQANDEVERISAEIHKCYCRAYENTFGKPYWTNGDYSKLDEPTKDYDRIIARWHIANRATPLVALDRSKMHEIFKPGEMVEVPRSSEELNDFINTIFNRIFAKFGTPDNKLVALNVTELTKWFIDYRKFSSFKGDDNLISAICEKFGTPAARIPSVKDIEHVIMLESNLEVDGINDLAISIRKLCEELNSK